MSLLLRPAELADLDPLVDIAHEAWRDAHPFLSECLVPSLTRQAFLALFAERPSHATVAEIDGVVVAFSVVKENELQQMGVDRRFRGRGVAGALLAHAERRVAADGHARIWMLISEESEAVQRLCRRAGWRRTAALVVDVQTAACRIPVPTCRFERLLSERAA